MTQYKNVDGVRSEMTQAEIDAHAITQNEITFHQKKEIKLYWV